MEPILLRAHHHDTRDAATSCSVALLKVISETGTIHLD